MIKEFRKQMGWSQKKLSEMTGIPRSTISDIERGVIKNSTTKNRLDVYISSYITNEKFHKMVCDLYSRYNKEEEPVVSISVLPENKSIWQRIKDWWLK